MNGNAPATIAVSSKSGLPEVTMGKPTHLVFAGTMTGEPTNKVNVLISHAADGAAAENLRNVCLLQFFQELAATVHNAIQLNPEWANVPAVMTEDGGLYPVYEVVSEIDAAIDYEDIVQRLPGISGAHVAFVLEFVKGVMRFNTMGLDLEKLEDGDFESNPEFQKAIREAMASKDNVRI